MELDNLKTIWKDVGAAATSTSVEELQLLLSKKSKSTIAKMKHNLFMEMAGVVVLYTAAVLYYFLTYKGLMLVPAWLLIAVGLFYMGFYLRKRKLLQQMECVTCEVKSNLNTQLTTLEKYVRFYFVSGTLLFPVAVIITSVVFYLGTPHAPDTSVTKQTMFFYFLLRVVLISLALTVPIYFINKWYVNKLYGQHVKKLRAIVNEMNELPFQ